MDEYLFHFRFMAQTVARVIYELDVGWDFLRGRMKKLLQEGKEQSLYYKFFKDDFPSVGTPISSSSSISIFAPRSSAVLK